MSGEQGGHSFTVSSRSTREAIQLVAERFVEFGKEIVCEVMWLVPRDILGTSA